MALLPAEKGREASAGFRSLVKTAWGPPTPGHLRVGVQDAAGRSGGGDVSGLSKMKDEERATGRGRTFTLRNPDRLGRALGGAEQRRLSVNSRPYWGCAEAGNPGPPKAQRRLGEATRSNAPHASGAPAGPSGHSPPRLLLKNSPAGTASIFPAPDTQRGPRG